MRRPIYVFAGGGTGGHLIPALAVAEELTGLRPDARVVFACSGRAIDRRILLPTPHAVVAQAVRPMPRRLRGWGGFAAAYLSSRRLARRLVEDLRPSAVLGLGGFAAAPVVRAAAGRGIRTGLMNIDAAPGMANRLLARPVEVIFAQFERTAGAYGRWSGKVRAVGCPVRRSLLGAEPAEARRHFGLAEGMKTLLVVAGSLGSANINDAVAELRAELDGLSDRWQVLHVAGPGKAASVRAAWEGGRGRHVVMEFCERMDLAYAAADIVLCRAGAATIGELAATATPAVLVPYPYHGDRHQWDNAAPSVSAGAAEVAADVADPAGNAENLRGSLVAILRDARRLEAMRSAAGGLSRSNAAAEIAGWLAG